MMKKPQAAGLLAAMAACTFSLAAQAGEVYGGAGLPGVMLGYAHSANDRLTLRADLSTIGSISRDRTESGIDYTGTAKLNRAGLFADWFVAGGGFRLTGGVTFNDMKIDLAGHGNGGTITIGSNSYVTSTDDRFNVHIKFPSATPYVGIGWGHHAASAGWGFVFDLGGSIGRAKVDGSVSGPNLTGHVTQADIDAELAQVRDGVGKVRFVPQLSLGASYRF
jgi:hypothetical protein